MNALNGALLRMASEENTLVPESMATYTRGARTFRLAADPEPETRMWMLSGIAGGISPWYHHIGGSQNDGRMFEIAPPVFQWHRENEAYLYDREDMAGVGLVWSQDNSDFYGRGEPTEKCAYPWRGFGLALTKRRIPYLPVHADDIGKYANRIKTLVLPDIAVLTDSQMEAICAFVRAGGNLVLTGLTGTLDMDGEPLPESPLWKLLGLRKTGDPLGIFTSCGESWDRYEAHSYLRLPEQRHPILKGFEKTTMIGFGGGLQKVELEGCLCPIGHYIPAFPIYPPEFSWIRGECPELAPIYAGEVPYGGRVVYFAADVDRCCGRYQLPDLMRLLANAVEWAAGGDVPLRVEGPGYLLCRAYRQENRFIVQTVNLTNCNVTGYLDEVVPVGPVQISVRVGDMRVRAAQARVKKGILPLITEGEYASVTVDSILDHELIVIE